MFSQACVGVGVSASVHARIHIPLGRQPPGQAPPLSRHPSLGRHPPRQTPLGRHPFLGRHPPCVDTSWADPPGRHPLPSRRLLLLRLIILLENAFFLCFKILKRTTRKRLEFYQIFLEINCFIFCFIISNKISQTWHPHEGMSVVVSSTVEVSMQKICEFMLV